MSAARCQVRFYGRVQGVGFRFTTERIASRFAITGFVRNEPDGSVQLVAEGEREEVSRLIKAIEEDMIDFIHRRELHWEEATGKWTSFFIDRS